MKNLLILLSLVFSATAFAETTKPHDAKPATEAAGKMMHTDEKGKDAEGKMKEEAQAQPK